MKNILGSLTLSERKSDGLLLAVSVLLGCVFWILRGSPPFPGSFIIKWTSIIIFAIIVWNNRANKQDLWLIASIVLQSFADVMLDIDKKGLLIYAMSSIAIGLVFYLLAFWPDVSARKILPKSRWLVSAGIVLYNAALCVMLSPHLKPAMVVAVTVYTLLHTAVTVSSILTRYPFWWIPLGFLMFVVSDTVNSIHIFVNPIGGVGFITWPTYYIGQFLISIGFVRLRGSRTKTG